MGSYQVLGLIHYASAFLLLSLAIGSILISVLIAVKPAADRASERLVERANTFALIEQLTVWTVALTGVIAVFMSSWSLSQPWLWMSLMVVVFYSFALQFMTKPARLDVAKGGSMVKAGLQVGLQVGHVLLLIVAFALMFLRPT